VHRSFRSTLFGAALLASPLSAQSLAGLNPVPGDKASGYLEVKAGTDSTRLPITVIRGATPGPVLALVAGTHGNELAPLAALEKLRRDLDPKTLSGTVILVHAANPPAVQARTARSSVDNKNLNRVYPGKADGTLTERIAFAITAEIVATCDYLIDLHSADATSSERPFTYSARPGIDAAIDSAALAMATAWGDPYIVWDNKGPRDPAASLYLQTTAHLRGKPALSVEAGSLDVPQSMSVARHLDGIRRVMRSLKMIAGSVTPGAAQTLLKSSATALAPESGMWRAAVTKDQKVTKDQLLGTLTDAFGEKLAEVRAAIAGRVMYVVLAPPVNKGDALALVASEVEGARP
jgi:predicted deacylase